MGGLIRHVASGSAGAVVLTAIHEFMRRRVANAPRMDVVGMRALERLVPRRGDQRVHGRNLHRIALAGDLVANSLYYAAVPASTARATWSRAAALGIAAGLGALFLPRPMGLGSPPHSHHPANQAMTIGWYLAGALAAAAVAVRMDRTR